ncbi:hypothetical protein Ancab_017898 [Ancistrocladus abbreviatus]
MNPKHLLSTVPTFLLGCLLALSSHVYFFSPICPDLLHLPSSPSSLPFPSNNNLKKVSKLGEGLLEGPEDVCVDRGGMLYTASRDGWIKRLHKNGTLENWKMANSSSLLGLTATAAGDIVVCDTEEGLLKANEDGITTVVSYFNGSRIRFADDVVEAGDGSLYFSVASTKFGLRDWFLDVLEAKPHGQLLSHNPNTNHTSLVLDNLCFPNGVALSKDQDYLVVCESWKFRCLKYWLEGQHRGKTEILVENLPGAPDNIKLAPDGSFWIAVLQLTSNGFQFIHKSKAAKHLVATFPTLAKMAQGANKNAMVLNVAVDGSIKRMYDDSNGEVMRFVTSVMEFDDHLYMGSLANNFIGKLPL